MAGSTFCSSIKELLSMYMPWAGLECDNMELGETLCIYLTRNRNWLQLRDVCIHLNAF